MDRLIENSPAASESWVGSQIRVHAIRLEGWETQVAFARRGRPAMKGGLGTVEEAPPGDAVLGRRH